MRVRPWLLSICLLGIAACSSSAPTAAEYAEEIEALVNDMEARFVEADAEWEAQTPTVEGALAYWDERMDIRTDFLDELEEVEVPPEVAEMHAESLEIFARITAADAALAKLVEEYDDVTEHRPWLDTPEGQASLAVLEDVYEFCRASQAEFDATSGREELQDTPWLPPAMRQVIKVAFGCPPAE